jgi:hypothetical protein
MTKPGHRLYRLTPGLKRCSARACASSVVSTITTHPPMAPTNCAARRSTRSLDAKIGRDLSLS